MKLRVTFIAVIVTAAGCAHYTTPGAAVPLSAIDDTDIADAFARQPAAAFPASIAVVRVQDAGYPGARHLGALSVVSVRDVESDDALSTLNELAMVRGVAPLSALLLPRNAKSIRDLRRPAAQLKADLLLVYTIDTRFTVDGSAIGPLSVISLGMLSDRSASVTATAAGVLVDVRTGFIYGAVEASAREQQRASAWTTAAKTDAARIRAERGAFVDFVTEFEDFWNSILTVYTRPAAPGTSYYVEQP